MAITAREPDSGDFVRILAPDGMQAAICCDVVDRGEVVNEKFASVNHKVSLHFLLAETIPSKWQHPHTSDRVDVHEDMVGRPYGISRWFTLSLHEKAALRQFLLTWRGKDFTAAELKGFDLEKLIGVPAALNIIHKQSQDGTKWYANIAGVSKLPAAWDAPLIPADYQRIKDRDNGDTEAGPIEASDPEGVGYGPGYDFSGEPIPEDDGTDGLPF